MEINLDEHYTIVLNQWGNPVLIKHCANAERDKHGDYKGTKLYFQTLGSAVETYIKKSASEADIKSFQELAAFIDGKLKGVELKINQRMKEK